MNGTQGLPPPLGGSRQALWIACSTRSDPDPRNRVGVASVSERPTGGCRMQVGTELFKAFAAQARIVWRINGRRTCPARGDGLADGAARGCTLLHSLAGGPSFGVPSGPPDTKNAQLGHNSCRCVVHASEARAWNRLGESTGVGPFSPWATRRERATALPGVGRSPRLAPRTNGHQIQVLFCGKSQVGLFRPATPLDNEPNAGVSPSNDRRTTR